VDLYYRVNVFDIRLPPLRERREDIVPLAESFLREFSQASGRPAAELTAAASDVLLAHAWPGNVRELRNALERATIVCEGALIRSEDLSLMPVPSAGAPNSTDLEVLERHAIRRVMSEANGNKSKAAQRLGISRTQLYWRLRKHGLGTMDV